MVQTTLVLISNLLQGSLPGRPALDPSEARARSAAASRAARAIVRARLDADARRRDEALRLADLERAFVKREAALFCVLALEFSKRFPASTAWSAICRLGGTLAPRDPLFGSSNPAQDLRRAA
jgi:hypothetical protein